MSNVKTYENVTEVPKVNRNVFSARESSYFFLKRLIDIIFSIVGLFLTIPVFITLFIVYQFGESRGPIFFKQLRYGRNGKKFYIFKFRSMIVNADKKLKENKLLYEKYIKNSFKLEPNEDPRITKLGLFLRKSSIDEIPQLLNVLKGDMSIIGPRPIVDEELIHYKEKKHIFLSVRPGLTGYWQVSGRSEVRYPERVDLELYYVYNKSIFLDIRIFFLTIYVVLFNKGAY